MKILRHSKFRQAAQDHTERAARAAQRRFAENARKATLQEEAAHCEINVTLTRHAVSVVKKQNYAGKDTLRPDLCLISHKNGNASKCD